MVQSSLSLSSLIICELNFGQSAELEEVHELLSRLM
jgi:hypothetical protein